MKPPQKPVIRETGTIGIEQEIRIKSSSAIVFWKSRRTLSMSFQERPMYLPKRSIKGLPPKKAVK